VNVARTDGALLAGVCAGIARTFAWNVWALRAVFVVFLLFKTLWAIAAYAALALAFWLLDADWPRKHKSRAALESPELASRNRRIVELERRFEELQRRE
jgi:phage shock protein PspC (stress-responsive transcriptional regulator)